jgi:hypothetical protein
MAGYSGTPLVKKLGIKPGCVALVVNAPAGYQKLLGDLPKDVQIGSKSSGPADLVHFFSKEHRELKRLLPELMKQIVPDGAIWISWPKKASGIVSSITEDIIREIALPLGLVDVKVCAVDEVWSGLKLVIRRENRTVRFK